MQDSSQEDRGEHVVSGGDRCSIERTAPVVQVSCTTPETPILVIADWAQLGWSASTVWGTGGWIIPKTTGPQLGHPSARLLDGAYLWLPRMRTSAVAGHAVARMGSRRVRPGAVRPEQVGWLT